MAKLVSSVPVAPAHPAGQGSAIPGGHIKAFRAQGAFAPSATLSRIVPTNPWRVGTPGARFYSEVLAHGPATVQAALDLGVKAGFTPAMSQGHLRWLYTWAGAYLAVDGLLYGQSAPVAAPKAPSKRIRKAA
jgi:hypothetical protein